VTMDLSVAEARSEWASKQRRMGCVSATKWFCQRVADFSEMRITRTYKGITWQHSVAFNGTNIVDLVPHLDAPCCWTTTCTCNR